MATAGVGAQMGDVVTEKADVHGLGGRQALFATEQGEQFVLAVAGDSRDTDDLAGAHFQVHLFEGYAERIGVVPGQPLDPQERRAALALRVFGFQPLGIADHQPRQFQVRALGRDALAGHAAGAQHRGALAQRAHLVELVADEQDAAALGRQPAQGHEQLVGLLRGKHRGRFVEDQQADVLHQAADDLHPLALADGQAVHQPLRLQRHAVALRDLTDLRLQLLWRTGPGAQRQGDVLRDRERLEQREVLEHHADAAFAGLGRVAHGHPFALPVDFAGVRLGHAVDDLHQGALAGAVLAEQGVDLAWLDRQVDTVVGQAAWVLFGYAAELEARGLGFGHGGVRWVFHDQGVAKSWPDSQELRCDAATAAAPPVGHATMLAGASLWCFTR